MSNTRRKKTTKKEPQRLASHNSCSRFFCFLAWHTRHRFEFSFINLERMVLQQTHRHVSWAVWMVLLMSWSFGVRITSSVRSKKRFACCSNQDWNITRKSAVQLLSLAWQLVCVFTQRVCHQQTLLRAYRCLPGPNGHHTRSTMHDWYAFYLHVSRLLLF